MNLHLLQGLHHGQILLLHVGHHPDLLQVGDNHHRVGILLQVLPHHQAALDHLAPDRRTHDQGLPRHIPLRVDLKDLQGSLGLLELLLTEREVRLGLLQRLLHAHPILHQVALTIQVLLRQCQLLLRLDIGLACLKISGRADLEKWTARRHLLSQPHKGAHHTPLHRRGHLRITGGNRTHHAGGGELHAI